MVTHILCNMYEDWMLSLSGALVLWELLSARRAELLEGTIFIEITGCTSWTAAIRLDRRDSQNTGKREKEMFYWLVWTMQLGAAFSGHSADYVGTEWAHRGVCSWCISPYEVVGMVGVSRSVKQDTTSYQINESTDRCSGSW